MHFFFGLPEKYTTSTLLNCAFRTQLNVHERDNRTSSCVASNSTSATEQRVIFYELLYTRMLLRRILPIPKTQLLGVLMLTTCRLQKYKDQIRSVERRKEKKKEKHILLFRNRTCAVTIVTTLLHMESVMNGPLCTVVLALHQNAHCSKDYKLSPSEKAVFFSPPSCLKVSTWYPRLNMRKVLHLFCAFKKTYLCT